MPAKAIGERAMTDAERQARYRAARAAGAPVIRTRRPAERADRWMQHWSASRPNHRSRSRRWNDAVGELTKLQAEYEAWLQSLPDNLHDTATAEALRAISELDLSELQAIVPPRGFGRD
jgi:hypothetical protein